MTTTRQLITDAYRLSGVVAAAPFETVSPEQESTGLTLLNQLLDALVSQKNRLPYYNTTTTFLTSPGIEKYFVPNLVSIETLTFVLGNVRYTMWDENLKKYFGQARDQNLRTLPGTYRAQRSLDGTTIYIYPLPETVYTFTIVGKFGFSSLTLDQDLTPLFEPFYVRYLKYSLSSDLADENGLGLPMSTQKTLKRIEEDIKNISAPDLTIEVARVLGAQPAVLNYAVASLNLAWYP